MPHKLRLRLILLTLSIGLAIIGGWLFIVNRRDASQLLPATIRRQLSFVVYLPGKGWDTSALSVGYAGGVLSYRTTQAGAALTVTQQTTPGVFNDVPQYYPNLVNKLNEYSSFGTANGTVYLTKPKELNGQQQAILNNNGTLLFAHPNHNLSDDVWRRFFNGLSAIKPD